MLSLLHASSALVNTYPAKSINLDAAEFTDGSFSFYEAHTLYQLGLEDPNAGYGATTTDGGYVVAGGALESESSSNWEGFAVKFSSTGTYEWGWRSNHAGLDDFAISVAQIPGGGDVIVSGYRSTQGVHRRCLIKLRLSDGAEQWVATSFGDSAGSHGAFEIIDFTADGLTALVGGFTHKPDTSEYAFRSGGNAPGGRGHVMALPVSSLTGSSAPTRAQMRWQRSFAPLETVHAVRGLPNGEVGVLLWSDGEGSYGRSASLAKLSATGAIEWGPLDYGITHGEGSDMQVSVDGSALVMTGHGECSDMLCGKLTKVAASDGSLLWSKAYASCNVPNECGTPHIKNECWGLQALSDGYILACGTGIEDCEG
jgi:hypothetical protein